MGTNKKASAHAPLITMADYVRIHAVAKAVLDGLDAHATKACIFFSLAGAYLLEKHHKLNARPMAGAAFYGVGGDPLDVLTYARFEDDGIVSDNDSFHCWVECEGWAIDFMAPLFGDILRVQKPDIKTPRKMFQRQLTTMLDVGTPLQRAGDYLLLPNKALTNDVLRRAMMKPATGDLAEVCAHWYRPSPKRIEDRLMMGSDDGSVVSLQLKPPTLTGAW